MLNNMTPHMDMKRRLYVCKKNNKGITLIELIVSIMVSSLVMLSVMFFASTGMRQYQNSSTETTLQIEAQTAGNQISELLMGASAYTYYDDILTGSHDIYKALVITSLSEETAYYYVITVNEADKLLLLYKREKKDTDLSDLRAMTEKIIEEEILAEPALMKRFLLACHVKSIILDPIQSSADESLSQLVHIVIDMELSGRTFTMTNSVTIRNGLH